MLTYLFFFWDGLGGPVAEPVDGPPITVAGLIYKPGGAVGKAFIPGAQKGMLVKDQ